MGAAENHGRVTVHAETTATCIALGCTARSERERDWMIAIGTTESTPIDRAFVALTRATHVTRTLYRADFLALRCELIELSPDVLVSEEESRQYNGFQ